MSEYPDGAKITHRTDLDRRCLDCYSHKMRPWPPGPWDDEPDRIEWREGGYVCLVLRGPSGGLCGYVGVEPGHPWHGKGGFFGGPDGVDAEVHGGVTYARGCSPKLRDGEQIGICHTPEPGEPEHLWWIGFDCTHIYDITPKYNINNSLASYRDVSYVVGQVRALREQAEAACAG